jgi:electron transfer flavoprotein alpha subunit
MTEHKDMLVFSDKAALLTELIGGAQGLAAQLGGEVTAAVAGPRAEADAAAAQGAERVYWLGEVPAGRMLEDYVATLAALVEAKKPAGVLIGATKRGKAIAGRLAARLKATVITDVKEIKLDGGALQARHMIFGGGAVRVEKSASPVFIATIGQSIFEPGAAKSGAVEEFAFVAPAWTLTVKEHKVKTATSVNLAAAKRVVSPGRGVAKEEDMAMINELAQLLGAEIGCTRPLAEGLDWLPRERYIGVSGAFLKADLYVGVGVSGQIQHMVGVTDSRVIVAVNKDDHAPVFEFADYGIVGDLYQVVPALIAALKAR